jgi:hypothetical protein
VDKLEAEGLARATGVIADARRAHWEEVFTIRTVTPDPLCASRKSAPAGDGTLARRSYRCCVVWRRATMGAATTV